MKKKCYDNRELSWLQFNERVLEEAEDTKVPLLERLSFTSIYQSNLDEFFMVRVGSLQDQGLISEDIRENKTNMTSKEQLDAIMKKTRQLNERKDTIYHSIMKELENYNLKVISFQGLSAEEEKKLEKYFDREVLPVLSPQIIAKKQPFPFLKNKYIYAVVSLETRNNNEKLGIIPCYSTMWKRLVPHPTVPNQYLLMEELILHFASKVFGRYKIKSKSLMRVTRNADISAEEASYEDDLDYREEMEELIKKRKKLSAVRLELSSEIPKDMVQKLCKYLDLGEERVFFIKAPLDLSFLGSFRDILKEEKELFYEKVEPRKPALVTNRVPMMKQALQRDILITYPYESMKPFLNLLTEAGKSPEVISIKMTLYRVARNSKVIEALIDAAENGKEVVVLVELQARFDEENNIEWSKRLEDAGCHIIYGVDSLKVHSKLCLITKKGSDGVSFLTQVGTGNYNESTAKLYTDYSLITSDPEIGAEAGRIFQHLAIGQVPEKTEHLLMAPNSLKQPIIEKIDRQIEAAKQGEEAFLGLKMNSLTDKELIDKLIEASCNGVKIKMIVRGICCLIPQIPGLTENIEVISIVGRFLEHSRIYWFQIGQEEEIYLSSADFMTRNTTRRVEIAIPVRNKELRERMKQDFNILWNDTCKARVKQADGSYLKRESEEEPFCAHDYFIKHPATTSRTTRREKKEKSESMEK